MANITIRRDNESIELDVDIRTELEAFPWIRPRWDSEKLIAASPFRYDRTPSFFVFCVNQYKIMTIRKPFCVVLWGELFLPNYCIDKVVASKNLIA